jgi:predicted nucleic acid-binding Zn ribbon protein
MSRKNQKQLINFEPCNRYCPICGIFVSAGSSFHYCSKKIIEAIDRERQHDEDKEKVEIERDKFQEADSFLCADDSEEEET